MATPTETRTMVNPLTPRLRLGVLGWAWLAYLHDPKRDRFAFPCALDRTPCFGSRPAQ